jgi:putative tryptophan/tyrosine transport system substrate-binding protein
MFGMRRREFVTLLSGAAVTWPLAARAQQQAMPVIGYLDSGSADSSVGDLAAFREGLRASGYEEGQNVAIEYCWGDDHNDRLPELAAELVRRRVAVLAALGTVPVALAAKAATATIPIVFAIGADPVAAGLVTSLSRPGGNLTGATRLSVELAPKRLEALREILPKATTVALLVNPTDPIVAEAQSKDLDAATRKLGFKVAVLHAGTDPDFEPAFLSIVQMKADALVIGVNALFGRRIKQLAALALRHAVPSIYTTPEFVAAGGLMSYGVSTSEAYRIGGDYTGRILKGEKPSELPVQQATKLKMIINLKTAKALGLEVPPTLLARADEVIE